MTFIKGVNRKGYMGHWGMNYHVSNVIDIDTNELIAEDQKRKLSGEKED